MYGHVVGMDVLTCMNVSFNICLHAFIYSCVDVCIYEHVCIYGFVDMYGCMQIWTCRHVGMCGHVCMFVFVHVCMNSFMYV